MRKKTPKAHDFEDGGGLVAGTHDVAEAVRIMREHYHDLVCGCESSPQDAEAAIHEELDWITAEDAELETGRFIPNGDGWTWRRGYALGVPGVTRAVVWHV